MSAYVVFIAAGEREGYLWRPVVVCSDDQVAEAVKEEIWQEILRLEAILQAQDESTCVLTMVDDQIAIEHGGPQGTNEFVRGYLSCPRMNGFEWWVPERPGYRGNGGAGRVEVTIVEVESIGPIV